MIGHSIISQVFELGFVSLPIDSYIEIGVQEGCTLRWVLKNNPDLQKVLVCDNWRGDYGGNDKKNHDHILKLLEEEAFPRDRVQFLDGDSRFLLYYYFQHHTKIHFELAFLDGDHSDYGLWYDLLNVFNYVDVILVDDIRHPDHLYLRGVLHQFHEQHRNEFVLIDMGENLAVLIRKTYMKS